VRVQLAIAESGEACLSGKIRPVGDRRDAVRSTVAMRRDRDQGRGELKCLGAIADPGKDGQAVCSQAILDQVEGPRLPQVDRR
jgi:hypothetical protein